MKNQSSKTWLNTDIVKWLICGITSSGDMSAMISYYSAF